MKMLIGVVSWVEKTLWISRKDLRELAFSTLLGALIVMCPVVIDHPKIGMGNVVLLAISICLAMMLSIMMVFLLFRAVMEKNKNLFLIEMKKQNMIIYMENLLIIKII